MREEAWGSKTLIVKAQGVRLQGKVRVVKPGGWQPLFGASVGVNPGAFPRGCMSQGGQTCWVSRDSLGVVSPVMAETQGCLSTARVRHGNVSLGAEHPEQQARGLCPGEKAWWETLWVARCEGCPSGSAASLVAVTMCLGAVPGLSGP
jgi:hypothetical protein